MTAELSRGIGTELAPARDALARDPAAAIDRLDALLRQAPETVDALQLRAMALRRLGRDAEARADEEAAIRLSLRSAQVRSATAAFARGDLQTAEAMLRQLLAQSPEHAMAHVILADIAMRVGIQAEAETLLRRACALAPDFVEAKVNLAKALQRQARLPEALAVLDAAMALDPAHIRAAATKADMLAQTGEYAQAAQVYEELLAHIGDHAEVRTWYGHLLKTLGRQDDAVATYRRALAIAPQLAEAWWSLSELKAGRLDSDDIAAMRQVLAATPGGAKQLYLHFALGKALEDQRDWQASFAHYAEGNRLRLAIEPHDRAAVEREVDRSIRLFDADFFAAHAGQGCPAPDPIFILGMPRAGSTLVEQILASHPQVEGTSELPDIPLLVQSLVARDWRDAGAAYPQVVERLDAATIRALGERYLESAGRHRKTAAPFFIDKLPNNWLYAGFIHLILPNARIIDARRDAMACCFSNFKQHFARGQTFAYSLTDLGSHYRSYVRLMAHFDGVLPGVIHRVQHEDLLADPEAEIRRLLDFLKLPFDERCLRPHENRRPVRTASSEQVRRPISRDAVELWRHYEPWLDELKAALGPLAPQ